MSIAEQTTYLSEADYLRLEEESETKHEYVDGVIYAMAGGKNRHGFIADNCYGHLWARLRKSRCRPFSSDTKVKVQQARSADYYYPDCGVVCDKNSDSDVFQEKPVLLIEVLSTSTRRTDQKEKRDAYLSISSLHTYLLIEQDRPEVRIYERQDDDQFSNTIVTGLDQVIDLPKLDTSLALAEIYEDITFE